METVGIRELKAHLSRHLKRVRSGTRLMVTGRGRSIATISPVHVTAASTDTVSVTTMQVYVDNKLVFQVGAAKRVRTRRIGRCHAGARLYHASCEV